MDSATYLMIPDYSYVQSNSYVLSIMRHFFSIVVTRLALSFTKQRHYWFCIDFNAVDTDFLSEKKLTQYPVILSEPLKI